MKKFKNSFAKAFLVFNLVFLLFLVLANTLFRCDTMFLSYKGGEAFCQPDIPIVTELLLTSQYILDYMFLTSWFSLGLPFIFYFLIWIWSIKESKQSVGLYVLLPLCIVMIGLLPSSIANFKWQVGNESLYEYLFLDEMCPQDSINGFSYYPDPGSLTFCYKTSPLLSAEPTSFISLQDISDEIINELSLDNVITSEYDFAFDRQNFYLNGNVVYSSNDATFQVIEAPSHNKEGLIVVNNISYKVVTTGIRLATLQR